MILITDRLILREFIGNDWQAVLAYQSHPHDLGFNPRTKRTAEEAQALLQHSLDQQLDPTSTAIRKCVRS